MFNCILLSSCSSTSSHCRCFSWGFINYLWEDRAVTMWQGQKGRSEAVWGKRVTEIGRTPQAGVPADSYARLPENSVHLCKSVCPKEGELGFSSARHPYGKPSGLRLWGAACFTPWGQLMIKKETCIRKYNEWFF